MLAAQTLPVTNMLRATSMSPISSMTTLLISPPPGVAVRKRISVPDLEFAPERATK